MVVKDLIDILKAKVILEGDLDAEIKTACGSDMMSDVLAYVKDQSVLLTGLVNPQVVRTAEMMDKRGYYKLGKNQRYNTYVNTVQNVYSLRTALFQWSARRL